MKTGICPKCGSTEVYMQNRGIFAGSGTLYMLKSFFASGIHLDAYLCTNCGHVELSVPASDLQKAQDLVEKWTKVKPNR